MLELPKIPCTRCDASLQGIALDGACKTCWRPVGDSLNTARIDACTMSVASDIPCLACGYNLRTQPIGGVCPECAHPVSESLGPTDLPLADTSWLENVRGGVTMLLVALAGLLLQAVWFFAVMFLGLTSLLPEGDWWTLLNFILGILAVGGMLAATMVEPDPKGRARSNAPNRAAQCAVLVVVIAVILLIVESEASTFRSYYVTCAGMSVVATGTAGILVSICLRRLAGRARHRRLGSLTAVLIWIIGVDVVILALVATAWLFLVPTFQAMAAAMAPVAPGGVNVVGSPSPDSDGSSDETDNSAIVVTVSPAASAPTVPGGPVMPALPGWFILANFMTCAGMVLALLAIVLGVVVLMMYRSTLSAAIAEASKIRGETIANSTPTGSNIT